MGRNRTFDTQEAVRAARSVFWSNGFGGASLPDLEQATGLNRSSLYHAFGSKRGLFDAAVDSYLEEVIRPRLRILTEAPGNGASIGGLKVISETGWFAARPSGTEDIYKIYAESFSGADHLHHILTEAQAIVDAALATPTQQTGSAPTTHLRDGP